MGLPFLTPLFTGTTPLLSETTKMGPPQFLTLFIKAAEYLDVFSRVSASVQPKSTRRLRTSGSRRVHDLPVRDAREGPQRLGGLQDNGRCDCVHK
jgi:hypothetical protein